MSLWGWTATVMSISLLLLFNLASNQSDEIVPKGRSLYLRHCASCHGEKGKGDGPLAKFVNPPVPDLTEGVFKFRSTPSGTLPTDNDLKRTISEGISSTPMMGVKGILTNDEIEAIVAFVKTLCPDFQTKGSGNPISIEPPQFTPDLLKLGRQIYYEFQCNTCHGPNGDGDGPMAKSLKDSKGRSIRILSFRDPRNFKGGHSLIDIYRSIMTGLDGTPMASFSEFLTEKEGWAVAYFVHSLIGKKDMKQSSNINVKVKRNETNPFVLSDASWAKLPIFELPLQSLWRTNKPETVRVQVIGDGQNLNFRLSWDDSTRNGKGKFLDSVSIQVPQNLKSPIPSLFWGDNQSPVLVFRWFAGDKLTVFVARGLGNKVSQHYYNAKAKGVWQKGKWSVTLQVKLSETFSRLPFAISIWDASYGDEGERRSITGWHWLEFSP
ncbi:MAG: c-type cytochrome [Armatimonadetes bacterium]|nr:c-type cytochrome [Armatimonadota bacterium]MDW8028989.1 c-type cytochrome [Armatimonadota bacterium]